MKKSNILYIVEGETDQKFIDAIKNTYIEPGRVKVSNPATKSVTGVIIRLIKKPTICILVFDKDIYTKGIANPKILKDNINKLKKQANVKEVLVACQDKDLEDEIISTTSIKKIEELLGSKTKKDFKKEVLKCNNLQKKLIDKSFNISSLWSKGKVSGLPKVGNIESIKK